MELRSLKDLQSRQTPRSSRGLDKSVYLRSRFRVHCVGQGYEHVCCLGTVVKDVEVLKRRPILT